VQEKLPLSPRPGDFDPGTLPVEARKTFADLFSLVGAGSEPNAEELAQHVSLLRAAAGEHGFLDAALLDVLAERQAALLVAADGLPEKGRQLALTAVAYFLLTDDDCDDDLESEVALEDSARVFNAVVHHLGLPVEPVALAAGHGKP